jgi:hypothetical protein
MSVVLLLAALAVLAGVVVVAVGRGGELTIFQPDVPPEPLAVATGAEVASFRPPPAFFGYSAPATDDALERIGRAVAQRDAELARLREQLALLRGDADPAQDAGPYELGQAAYPGEADYPYPGDVGYPGDPAYPGEAAYPGQAAYPGEASYAGDWAAADPTAHYGPDPAARYGREDELWPGRNEWGPPVSPDAAVHSERVYSERAHGDPALPPGWPDSADLDEPDDEGDQAAEDQPWVGQGDYAQPGDLAAWQPPAEDDPNSEPGSEPGSEAENHE